MGWRYTPDAGAAMRKLEAACLKTNDLRHVFHADGETFFFEYDPVNYPDGRVTGEVFREVETDLCRVFLKFEITARGVLRGGHKWMHDALAS